MPYTPARELAQLPASPTGAGATAQPLRGGELIVSYLATSTNQATGLVHAAKRLATLQTRAARLGVELVPIVGDNGPELVATRGAMTSCFGSLADAEAWVAAKELGK